MGTTGSLADGGNQWHFRKFVPSLLATKILGSMYGKPLGSFCRDHVDQAKSAYCVIAVSPTMAKVEVGLWQKLSDRCFRPRAVSPLQIARLDHYF
jgi:hypothetical protein